MKRGEKRRITKEIEVTKKKEIRTLTKKENYTFLGILEVDTIKQTDMREK